MPTPLPTDPAPHAPPPPTDPASDAPRPRLSPGVLRAMRVVFVTIAALVIGGGISVALDGPFASVPVAIAAAVIGLRVYRAPVRG